MSKNKKNLIRIIVTAAAFVPALVTHVLFEKSMPTWAWLIVFVAIYLAIGYDVLFRAARNIVHGKVFDENFLMIVATVGAFAIGEYAESVAVMLFYQAGEFFQSYAVGKSRKSISALMDICPETACLITDDGEQTVYPDEVEIGSTVVVRAGEKVPIDGVIVEGDAVLDCSALTGESLPVKKSVGDEVLSGSINVSSVIKVRTQKKYEDSTVAKILDLVENASSKKAKSERFITRFAAVYTPVVVAIGVLIAVLPPLIIAYGNGEVWREWISRALTFLVVSCPCALVISVPLSFFGGIGAASKRGILVKGGNYLEILNKTDTLVLDKTGTITKGSFEVTRVEGERGRVLLAAATAEKCSLHPIALSVVAAAEKDGISVTDTLPATEIAGRGVSATDGDKTVLCGSALLMEENGIKFTPLDGAAGTVVYVAENGEYLGAIEISDAVKDDSAAALSALKAMSVRTVMLTGDRRAAAENVAASVGIDEVHAELLPDKKVERIEEIIERKKENKRGAVAFVGDGINDAPVLSRADIGIAMGALGSDAAIEAADIVLMNDSLTQIVSAKRIAKKTVSIVIQNIVFALGVKVAVLILAALGIASIWLAVFADVGVAVLAILNAMRALRVNDKQNSPKNNGGVGSRKAA
ncbi:MAG: heavy metal translocating P-type ATPase [Clostridiales bacterium]|nr:heavy metal translocating P-type ATPase [Clostridiales bacterium]